MRRRIRPPVQTLGFSFVSRATSSHVASSSRVTTDSMLERTWRARSALTSPAEHVHPLPPERERAPVRVEGRRIGGGTHERLLAAHGPTTCQPTTCLRPRQPSTANQTAATKARWPNGVKMDCEDGGQPRRPRRRAVLRISSSARSRSAAVTSRPARFSKSIRHLRSLSKLCSTWTSEMVL